MTSDISFVHTMFLESSKNLANLDLVGLNTHHGLLLELQGNIESAAAYHLLNVEHNNDAKFNYGRIIKAHPELFPGIPKTLGHSLIEAAAFAGSENAKHYLGRQSTRTTSFDLNTAMYWLGSISHASYNTSATRLRGLLLLAQGKFAEGQELLQPLAAKGDRQLLREVRAWLNEIRDIKSARDQQPAAQTNIHQLPAFALASSKTASQPLGFAQMAGIPIALNEPRFR